MVTGYAEPGDYVADSVALNLTSDEHSNFCWLVDLLGGRVFNRKERTSVTELLCGTADEFNDQDYAIKRVMSELRVMLLRYLVTISPDLQMNGLTPEIAARL
jgi:hypothetical protein